MKERIYTIPVNDAFNTPCECPVCEMENKTTNDLLAYFMGPSMMEPDVRISTNTKGFCREHLAAMYNRQENRLALGLMLHTHLVEMCETTEKNLKKARVSKNKGGFLSLKSDYKSTLTDIAEKIEAQADRCVLCDRLEYTMDRYIDVILWQYFEDKAFREKFDNSNGFCLPHLALLLRGAAKYLSQNEASEFIEKLSTLENSSVKTLQDELLWFTQKFDYMNEDKPWGNSKDAIPRTIRKLTGRADLKQ